VLGSPWPFVSFAAGEFSVAPPDRSASRALTVTGVAAVLWRPCSFTPPSIHRFFLCGLGKLTPFFPHEFFPLVPGARELLLRCLRASVGVGTRRERFSRARASGRCSSSQERTMKRTRFASSPTYWSPAASLPIVF
jgi:hypothetical protein